MEQGTVKSFNEVKGFGFITPNRGGTDIFVHVSDLIDEIKENDAVTFEREHSPKGAFAVRVKVVS